MKFQSVDEYISMSSPKARRTLKDLRRIIRQAAPKAEEVISYNMPALKQNRVLVYYAAFKNHIGFYPTSAPIIVFKNALKDFKTSKGAIQFPIGQPLPSTLIAKIVRFRLGADAELFSLKKKK